MWKVTNETHMARKKIWRGVTNPVLGGVWWLLEMPAFFQSIPVNANILTYLSFLLNSLMKGIFSFKIHNK